MAITWGAESGKEQVGIDIIQSPSTVSSSTTSVTVTIDYYVRSVNWGFNDSQTMTIYGFQSGTYNFDFYSPSGTTTTKKVATRTATIATSYSSGTHFEVGAGISGSYNGGTPSHTRGWDVPARPATVPSAPGTPSVSSITNTTASTSWSAPSSNGGATVSGYDWQLSLYSDFRSFVTTTTPSGTSQNVTGLQSKTNYYIRVRAKNSAGAGPWSGTRFFTTHGVPSAPATPTISNVGQNDATAAWSAPANNGASISSYDIQIATNSTFTTGLVTNNQGGTTKTWTTLSPDVLYYVRVRANNTYGNGAWSATATFETFFESLETYPTPTPLVTVASSFGTARVFFTVDVVEPHPFIGGTRTISYELATDASFTQNVISETINFVSKGFYNQQAGESYTWPTGTNSTTMGIYETLLKQGTWYLRVRAAGSSSMPNSSYAATKTFTVSHAPAVTVVSPSSGQFAVLTSVINFRFNATDAWSADTVSAYQILVENNSTGANIIDTGKVAQALPLGSSTIALAVSAAYLDVTLRWRVRVWDSTDTASTYSSYGIFTPVLAPAVTITSPLDSETIATGRPKFDWTVGLSLGRTVSKSLLTVRDIDLGEIVWQREYGAGVLTATPSQPILVNGLIYSVTLDVTDSKNITGTATNTFSTSFVSPDPIAYNVRQEDLNDLGYVQVEWVEAVLDEGLIAWHVYRKEMPTGEWELIQQITDLGARSYNDYLVESGKSYMYSVTQLADRFGDVLESPVGTTVTGGNPEAEGRVVDATVQMYWLICLARPELTTALPGVIDEPSTLEYESESYTLIGRGRHVDYGDRLGYSGSLTIQVRQPEVTSSLRKRVEELREAQETYYLRTPFGKLFPVALGNPEWTPRRGTGLMEMGDLSLPYEEVG